MLQVYVERPGDEGIKAGRASHIEQISIGANSGLRELILIGESYQMNQLNI